MPAGRHFRTPQAARHGNDHCAAARRCGASPVWTAAVAYYHNTFAQYELSAPALKGIKDHLVQRDPSAPIQHLDLPPILAEVLATAAPVYQQQWWSTHQRLNAAWIDTIIPHVGHLADRVLPQIVAAFQTRSPDGPTRIDVTTYAGWAGAYTTYNPPFPSHITIASTAPANQGWHGLEIVFHEAAHTLVSPVSGALVESIARARARVAQPGPQDLWHVILFYTVGELIRRLLAGQGGAYVPYADQQGLYDRAPGWKAVRDGLERYWPAYLDGRQSLDATITAILKDLH